MGSFDRSGFGGSNAKTISSGSRRGGASFVGSRGSNASSNRNKPGGRKAPSNSGGGISSFSQHTSSGFGGSSRTSGKTGGSTGGQNVGNRGRNTQGGSSGLGSGKFGSRSGGRKGERVEGRQSSGGGQSSGDAVQTIDWEKVRVANGWETFPNLFPQ